MTLKQEDDHVQLQGPLRIIIKDNGYIEVIRYEEGRISISVYGHAIITNEFLEAMQNSGYKLDRIFNEIDSYNVPENSKEIIDPIQAKPSVPPFIETIIRFEDTTYLPDLESCCKKCGKQEEGTTQDQQEDEDENAMDYAKLDEDEHSA